ncbi:MAG: sodium:proton antiporter, partial [Lachnospiraceae bacterium]
KGLELSGVHWLSPENLKGAAISLIFGALVYLFVVRIFLMKKENGVRVYVNRIPRWFDLEESFYRPVLLHFLPFVCAFFCRLCDTLVDGVTTLLKNTVLAPRKRRMSIWVGTKFTHMLGTAMDAVVSVLNRTLFRNHPISKSFVSVLAVSEQEAKQTFSLITGSVSFGLLLAAMGLAITLLYLLF